jgi:hypothetical protein
MTPTPMTPGPAPESSGRDPQGLWWPRGLMIAGLVVVLWNIVFAVVAIRTASPVVESYTLEHR